MSQQKGCSEAPPPVEDTEDNMEKAAAPQGSLASFFEKAKNKTGEKSSFQQLEERQETNLKLQGEFDNHFHTASADALEDQTSYQGEPWGRHRQTRRVPNMDLLHMVFQDQKRYENGKPPPHNIGGYHDMLTSLKGDPLYDEAVIAELDDTGILADMAKGGIIDAPVDDNIEVEVEESTSSSNDSDSSSSTSTQEDINNSNNNKVNSDDFVEGLDDIDKFFEGVDPPEELDVGGASGLSMQEVIMGKGQQILFKKVHQILQGVCKFYSSLHSKVNKQISQLKEKFHNNNKKEERKDDQKTSQSSSSKSNKPIDNLKQTANNLWNVGKDTFEQLVDWVDGLIDKIFDKDDYGDDDTFQMEEDFAGFAGGDGLF